MNSSNSKVIASCGLERDIYLWSPYSKSSMATLHGHTASVTEVIANDEENQLISLAIDHVVRVWDIRNQKCVQVIQTDSSLLGATTYHLDGISAVHYNPRMKCLYTGL
jgi:WD40 repeat protein